MQLAWHLSSKMLHKCGRKVETVLFRKTSVSVLPSGRLVWSVVFRLKPSSRPVLLQNVQGSVYQAAGQP